LAPVVFSGIKQDEALPLIELYTEKHFECKWNESGKDLAGLVFLKCQKTDLII